MRAVSASGNTVDSLRVAVLAALNIADELMRLQEHCRLLRGTMSETQTILRTRANSLSGLLDSVLDEEHRYHERFRSQPASIPGRHLPISFADVSIHSETGLQSRYGS